MNRLLSASFALGSLLGTIIVSVFAFTQLKVMTSNAAAVPVKPPQIAVINNPKATSGDYAGALRFFADRGIMLSIAPSYALTDANWSTFSSSADANVSQAASELQTEFQKYTKNGLQNSGLKSIYLVKDLVVNGQARSGMPEPRTGKALYFDVSDIYLQSEDGMYMRRTFHHEFSHFTEYNLFGSYAPDDATWTGCNNSSFRYGNGGASMYADPEFAHKSHPTYGFIDGYATSAIEEDKAEMFAWYLTDAPALQKLASKDAGVACKLLQTKSLYQTL